MSKFPRLVVPGYPHHVTQRGVRRQTTFFDATDYRAYLQLAAELLQDYALEIWAYCLMPNHIHAVVVPPDVNSMSKFFALLHRQYARRTNLRHEWSGHLWQKRYFSVVMDEPHTYTCMRYVEHNPIRSSIVPKAADWPWSSARANLEITQDPLINRERTRAIVANWSSYLSEAEDPGRLEGLRMQTISGRPGGTNDFLIELEKKTGRRIRKKRPGRRPRI